MALNLPYGCYVLVPTFRDAEGKTQRDTYVNRSDLLRVTDLACFTVTSPDGRPRAELAELAEKFFFGG